MSLTLLSESLIQQIAADVPLQTLHWPALTERGITPYLRRDDLLQLSGNKFYKLFYNLLEAQNAGQTTLVSFGGAYSNHLYALAEAGHRYGFRTVGIVRGHPSAKLSPTLKDAQAWGMHLHYLDRVHYKTKNLQPLLPILETEYPDYWLIPEGGANLAGVRGCRHIALSIAQQLPGEAFTVCCATGTGATLAGISAGLPKGADALGISVLKGEHTLRDRVNDWLRALDSSQQSFQLVEGYHHGGYARTTPELLAFMGAFEQANTLLLEPVYTAKLLWAVEQMALQGRWVKGSRLVIVHSGGLQGRRGFSALNEQMVK